MSLAERRASSLPDGAAAERAWHFPHCSARTRSRISRAKIPAAAILEGGYSDDLPRLIHAFLTGWES